MNFIKYDKKEIIKYRDNLATIQAKFLKLFGVNDIFSNSKVYEVTIANELNHQLIKGHSGSRDAIDRDRYIDSLIQFKVASMHSKKPLCSPPRLTAFVFFSLFFFLFFFFSVAFQTVPMLP